MTQDIKTITFEEMLIESYKKHQSTRKVGLEFGISHEKARYRLKALGVLNKPLTRYLCDDGFFSRDTTESFYWAGFIAADGCVKLHGKKYKQLNVGLAIKDLKQVEKLKSVLKYAGPINMPKKDDLYPSCSVCISSDKLFDDLARFGVIQRKSLVLTFPEWLVEHKWVNHFMRGYNDGDGSFFGSISRVKAIEHLHFSLRGTEQFLTTFRNILEKNCPIKKYNNNPRENCGIYMLEYGGNKSVLPIRDFLYKDSTEEIRLDRKYNICYSGRYFIFPEGFDSRHKKVIGTNMETGEEISFDAMMYVEKQGFLRGEVSECCRGLQKFHNGYTWRYA